MEEYNKEVGEYIQQKMYEQESHLRDVGKLKNARRLSNHTMAKELDVSGTWLSSIVGGRSKASDEFLIKIVQFLEIEDEHEIFKVAKRIHPTALEEYRKEYLGEHYEKS